MSLKKNVRCSMFPLYAPATCSLVRATLSSIRDRNKWVLIAGVETVFCAGAYKSHAGKAYLYFDKSSVFQSVTTKKCQHILCILADMNSLGCK